MPENKDGAFVDPDVAADFMLTGLLADKTEEIRTTGNWSLLVAPIAGVSFLALFLAFQTNN